MGGPVFPGSSQVKVMLVRDWLEAVGASGFPGGSRTSLMATVTGMVSSPSFPSVTLRVSA